MPTLTLHDVPLEVLATLEERARLDQRSAELEACAQLVELLTIRQADSPDALPRASFGSQLMTFLNEPEHLDELGERAFEVERAATDRVKCIPQNNCRQVASMTLQIPITNNSSDSLEIVFEPQGVDYCLERGSTMIIEFSGHSLPEGFEIVFYDHFVEVYPGMLYRVFVDGIEVREF